MQCSFDFKRHDRLESRSHTGQRAICGGSHTGQRFFRVLFLAGLLLAGVGAGACKRNGESDASAAKQPASTAAKLFTDVTSQAGITHTHHKPVLDHKLDNIMSWVSSVGAAAAAGDYDNDGWIDLYVTDSRKGTPNYLYRNNGDGTFTDVAKRAGVADLNGERGTSMDCVWGDYDNDGWIDLYVVRWGNDALFRNNRDGTFTDVTHKCFRKRDGSPGTDWANGNAVVFFDYNLDGRLDIYVGNYFREVDLWNLESTVIMHDSFENARNGGKCFLYRQEPDGTFTETAEALGVADEGWTLAVGSADLNNDGWPDLYCADDFGPDQLFLNIGDGTFRNVAEEAIGVDTKKGMNVDFGDFNNDGWLDVYVANITTAEYLQEGNMLWYNNGVGPDGRFTMTDVSLETGTYDGGWGWGAKFFDYDNDADLDIVAVNGFISAGEGNYWYDLASWTVTGADAGDARNWPAIGNRSFSGYETTRLWRNDGFHSFSQRAAELGVDTDRDGRGLVCFDYDNDGDLDIFIANQDQPPNLFRNEGTPHSHSLTVALQGDHAFRTTRDAVGARVTVVTAGGTQIRERDGGNGYSGQSDPRLHFGLGGEERVRLLEVRWPDGGLQYLEDVAADRVVTIRQDPKQYTSRVAVAVPSPEPWKGSAPRSDVRVVKVDLKEVEPVLADLEARLRAGSRGFTLAGQYRLKCSSNGLHDRSIKFFEKLAAERPDDDRVKLELACAYVDKIPTCGGIAAIVSKGTLARKSLDQLDLLIRKDPDSWVAHYCRAMNHLHWPRALRHSDDAAADFNRCIELQKSKPADERRHYFVRSYIGLGDAYAKAKQYDKARAAWREGLALFADSGALADRLAIDDGELSAFIEEERNLEEPIDTDFGFLDGP